MPDHHTPSLNLGRRPPAGKDNRPAIVVSSCRADLQAQGTVPVTLHHHSRDGRWPNGPLQASHVAWDRRSPR